MSDLASARNQTPAPALDSTPDILLVGTSCVDIINTCHAYPEEDSKVRALSQSVRIGGNATNSAVVLARVFQASVALLSNIGTDPFSDYIRQQVRKARVSSKFIAPVDQFNAAVSYITCSEATGSRTVVHYRDLPEVSGSQFLKCWAQACQHLKWVHFEGKNISETKMMLQQVKTSCLENPHLSHIQVSVEIEKIRPGVEELLRERNFDVVFFSKNYVLQSKFSSAETFLKSFLGEPYVVFLSWGEEGGWCVYKGVMVNSPRPEPIHIVDTVGAGDTFNAAVIYFLRQAQCPHSALLNACQIASHKCTLQGFSFDLKDAILK